MSFPNRYIHRRVANANARSCEICFKPSASVLVTEDKKDFFYVCPSHIKDRNFCTPQIDPTAEEARKKKEMEEEIKRVKEEYEAKQRKKKDQESTDKDKTKDEAKSKDKTSADSKAEESKSDASTTLNADEQADKTKGEAHEEAKLPVQEEPRVFELKSTFYQQRVSKKRQAEMAKRNRDRLQDPNFFPSVPKGQP